MVTIGVISPFHSLTGPPRFRVKTCNGLFTTGINFLLPGLIRVRLPTKLAEDPIVSTVYAPRSVQF